MILTFAIVNVSPMANKIMYWTIRIVAMETCGVEFVYRAGIGECIITHFASKLFASTNSAFHNYQSQCVCTGTILSIEPHKA